MERMKRMAKDVVNALSKIMDLDRVGCELLMLTVLCVIARQLPVNQVIARGTVTIVVMVVVFIIQRTGGERIVQQFIHSMYKNASWNGQSENNTLSVFLAFVIQVPIVLLSVLILCTVPWGLIWVIISVAAIESFVDEDDENDFSGRGNSGSGGGPFFPRMG